MRPVMQIAVSIARLVRPGKLRPTHVHADVRGAVSALTLAAPFEPVSASCGSRRRSKRRSRNSRGADALRTVAATPDGAAWRTGHELTTCSSMRTCAADQLSRPPDTQALKHGFRAIFGGVLFGTCVAHGLHHTEGIVMNTIARTTLLVSFAVSMLAGCTATGAGGTRTAYEKACRSPMMKGAAAREAYWCWQQVGAKSYEEWMTYERVAATESAELVAERSGNGAH
jgi:hypothetical protein